MATRRRKNADEYFASIQDPEKLADEMLLKISEWRGYIQSRGLADLWRKKLSNYYGISANGNSSQNVNRGGSEGELSLIKVNDLHSLIQNQLVIVTSQRPAGIARAINTNVDSLKSARIGTAIAEYYQVQGGFESKFVQAAETALLCDEAFLDIYWDKMKGDPIAVDHDTMEPVMSGDLVLRTHCPWNVARDTGSKIESQNWYIISYRDNRWDLAKTYPKFEEEILSATDGNLPNLSLDDLPESSDQIYVHLLVHDRSPSVRDGRYALLVGTKIVYDSELPFKDFPVDRMSPSDVIDGLIGYSSANDIMALEETTDALNSIVVTNQVTFGGQVIIGPIGANIKHTDVAKGVRYFEVQPEFVDKIRPLDLLRTSPEIFNYINALGTKKEQQVGVNSVVRGQPEGQLSGASGSALALIQAQAISYNSGIQRSYFRMMSAIMTKAISVLRSYADTPRVAAIVGKSKSQGLKQFKYTGKDLSSISSIVYEQVNPVSQSIGGRMQMAQDLIKAGMIKSPKQYISLLTTGNLDTVTQDDEADELLILEENEFLSEGKPVQAVLSEMHSDHIKSHMSVLSSMSAKQDPQVVQITTAHIQEHIDMWTQLSQTNPGFLMATGQQPIPMPMAPPGMPGPGGPGAPQGPQQLEGPPQAPSEQQAQGVNMPSLPNVAGTQDQAQVPGVTA